MGFLAVLEIWRVELRSTRLRDQWDMMRVGGERMRSAQTGTFSDGPSYLTEARHQLPVELRRPS